MNRSFGSVTSILVFTAMIVMASTLAYAQGSATSSIIGTVVDASGAVIPGADVVAKNNGTGATYSAVTSDRGSFTIPAVNPGMYTVTVSLTGFKTVVLNDVEVNVAVPASVRATLEVGTLAETIVVEAASSVVQTTSSAIATTVTVAQISNIPLTSRNVLDFVPFLPGVNTPGGNRSSTVNGLPRSAINITLDGINVQDNTLKSSDGFFTIVQPRLDAIEEVTVTMAAQGAESAGQGAVQIRFITRSGTNEYRGSGYHYYRDDALNANTWFNKRNNLPKPSLLQNQGGLRMGGPIIIPGLWSGRNKGFFFFNYEELRQPQDVARNRTVMHPLAEQGIFRYNVTVGGQSQVREVNLLSLAARSGQTATMDPTIAKLLGDIRNATGTIGTLTDLTDPNLQRYSYNQPQRSHNRYPTVRLDFNLTDRHRLSGSGNYHTFNSIPDTLNNRDPFFPGFPATGTQTSERIQYATSLRSTLGSNLVNELRVGGSGAPVYFFKELNAGMWGGTPVADQGGFHLNIAAAGITNAANTPTPSSRNATTKLVENTLNWLKGAHSLSFGGSFTEVDIWLRNQTLVPQIDFGIVPGDPAGGMFTTANFPGAAAADLTRAQNLYAVLTGRVLRINGNARIDENTSQYTYLGPAVQRARMRDFGIFVQDSWRMRPNLTVNFGLRYELQLPFYALNDSYSTATVADVCGVSGVAGDGTCNLFQPGVLTGQTPRFINLPEGEPAFNTDLNNWAPSGGFAWTPTAQSGFLRSLVGQDGDTVIRGGYALAYNRNGMSDFTGVFGSNPGVLITVNRDQSLGNLGTLPVLFRERGRLGPPPVPAAPEYLMSEVVTGDVNIFDPDLQVPYSQSWSIGIQRAVSKNMAVEARYVGTRHGDGWTTYNYNEVNILENGFLDEFRRAQANLQANIAAGRGNTFRYFGPGTGTSPLPVYLAYFNGVPLAQAGDATRYTSTLFSNTNFLNPLALYNPSPYTHASNATANGLFGDATRRANALRAGLPANFFIANPDLLGGANITGNGEAQRYHSLQLELRRRLSAGLQFQSSYVYGKTGIAEFFSFRKPRQYRRDVGDPGEVTHALKATWLYELPFGRGRRFASGAGVVLDRLIGGWSFTGTARIQNNRLINLGNVRMVGFNEKDLRDMFKLRIDENRRVWMLPKDVIDNTVAAFSVSATSSTGYGPLGPPSGRYFAPANRPDCIEIAGGFGDCGVGELVVHGPRFQSYDLSVLKEVPIKGRVNVEFRVEMLNAFNNVNFIPVGGIGSIQDSFEVTGLTGTNAARVVQLVTRINW